MAAVRQPHGLGAQAQQLGAEGVSPFAAPPSRRPLLFVLGAYVAVGAIASGVSLGLGHDPTACPSWLGLDASSGILVSLGLGVCLGAVAVAVTRELARRVAWGRALHEALRPAVRDASDGSLVVLALASAAGEELLFRGLLVPWIGVVASSVLFAVGHQVRGPARLGWMASAAVLGAAFGALFVATGSLAGPLAAHFLVNAKNLRFVRDRDPSPPRPRPLGGLLRRG